MQGKITDSSTSDPSVSKVAKSSTASRRGHRSSKRWLRRLRKFIKWQYILIPLLIIVLVPTAILTALLADSNARVEESWTGLKRVLSGLSSQSLSQMTTGDIERIQFSINALAQNLIHAEQQSRYIRPLVSIHPETNNRLQLLPIAKNVVLAAQEMVAGMQPSLYLLLGSDQPQNSTLSISVSERLVELLKIGQGNFIGAQHYLELAQGDIQSLNLANMSPDLWLTTQDIIRYHQQVIDLNHLMLDSPDLVSKAFGLDEPQDYLLLSQNSDELRPSGGYISTWGWMRIRRSEVVDYGYNPVSPTSPNPPPSSMVSELQIPPWWIEYNRPIYTAFDGSWYADFPETARMAAWFYDNGENPRSPVDGVIAIDIAGFERILSALKSVRVSGYDDIVTAENFREVIYKIRTSGEGDAPHKQFLSALYKQILKDWQEAGQDSNDGLFAAMLSAIQEKHVMLYFKDEKLNRAVNILNWNGAQTSDGKHDYLMVADANLGNKSNRSIVRQLTYDADIQDDGSIKSRTSIAYDYSAQLAEKDPGVQEGNYSNINYFNIMQVFVPPTSELVETKNLQSEVNTASLANLTAFITLTEVKFDSTERYQFSYTTPTIIEAFGNYRRYRLLLQKQAGMLGEMADVQVSLPPNASLVTTTPAPVTNYNLSRVILSFRVQLKTDQWIEVVYKN